jgi:hypothetical protein
MVEKGAIMRARYKLLASLTVAVGVALTAAPVTAAVIAPFSAGVFSLPGNPGGVIAAGTFLSGSNVYDFTFSIAGGPFHSVLQMQSSAVADGSPQTIAFQLFSGSPGSGVLLANSGGTPTAATLLTSLGTGSYYAEVTTVSAPNQLATGGITLLSAPEPAAWTTLLLGFGSLGALVRRRRALAL